MKLNLKQKKMQKKMFCVLIIYCTFFLLPLIGLQFHLKLDLLVFIPDVLPFTSYNNLTVTVANCYYINSTLGLLVEVKGC